MTTPVAQPASSPATAPASAPGLFYTPDQNWAINVRAFLSAACERGRLTIIAGHHSTRAYKMWCSDQETALNDPERTEDPLADNATLQSLASQDAVTGRWTVKPVRECNVYRLSQLPIDFPCDALSDENMSEHDKRLTVARLMATADNISGKAVSSYAAISPYM